MNRIINKWKKMPNSVKSAIVFSISSFVIKGISFLVTPIFTRIMDINEYGIIVTYNSWLSIIEVFAILGLTSAGVFNVGLNENKENRDKYISNCIVLCNISTIIVFAIIFIIKLFANNFLLDYNLLIIMFIYFMFSPAQIFWLTRQKYEYKYKLAVIITIISTILSQGLSLLFIYLFSNNALFKLLGTVIGALIITIPIYIILLMKGKEYFNFKEWRKVLRLAIPLIPHYLAQHLMSNSDRIMISEYVNRAGAAIYGVISYIGLIASIIWNSINSSLVPYTFEKLNKKEYTNINKIAKKLTVGYAIVCCIIVIIAPEFLKILAPQKYYGGLYAVPPIVFHVYLGALYNLFANIEFYHKKTGMIATATCISAVINIILNFLFIPKYGYVGASYTTMISTIATVLFHYYGYKKCIDEKIYDTKFMFAISFSLLIFILFSNILYLNTIIRYTIVASSFVIILVYRKKVLKILKELKK